MDIITIRQVNIEEYEKALEYYEERTADPVLASSFEKPDPEYNYYPMTIKDSEVIGYGPSEFSNCWTVFLKGMIEVEVVRNSISEDYLKELCNGKSKETGQKG